MLVDCTPLKDGPRGTGAFAGAGAVAVAVAVSDFTAAGAWMGLAAGALSLALRPFLQEWNGSAIRAMGSASIDSHGSNVSPWGIA